MKETIMVADRENQQGTVVLIPLGSCEQHDRHLPLSVDSLQIKASNEGEATQIVIGSWWKVATRALDPG